MSAGTLVAHVGRLERILGLHHEHPHDERPAPVVHRLLLPQRHVRATLATHPLLVSSRLRMLETHTGRAAGT